jgi:peptidoglycan/LPS O-acetylase OafA/YrhL
VRLDVWPVVGRTSGTYVPDVKRLGYRPELDGIRAVAISLVVLDHFFGLDGGGSAGVRLFFVLSGFLITTLLLEEHAATGSIKLGAFYRRRARRLLPALAALLLVYVGFQAGHLGISRAAERVALAGSYVSNFAVAFRVHDVISGTALGPLWSLAQEEQFYAFWPLLLIAVIRSRRFLTYLLAAFVALLVY